MTPDRRRLLFWLIAGLVSGVRPSQAGGGTSGNSGAGGSGAGGSGAGGSLSTGSDANDGAPTGESGTTTPGADSPAPEEEEAEPSPDDAGGVELDQEAAFEAVKKGQALPLRAFRSEVEQKYGGEIIDAALQRVGRKLRYKLKMLSQGRVFSVSVDAATGRPG